MTSNIWNVVKDHLGSVIMAILSAIVTFALDYWKDLIGSAFHTFWWFYGLPGITLYFVYRLSQFVNGIYQRIVRLEAQVLENRSNAETKAEALVKSLQASRDEAIRTFEKAIANKSQELDSQAQERGKFLQKVLRGEIKLREDLEQEVSKLKIQVAAQAEQIKKLTERHPTPAELLTSTGGILQKGASSLADMTPGGMLTQAHPRLGGTKNGGSGTPHDL